MTQTATIPGGAPTMITAERFTEAFRWMLLSRTVEDKIAALYHAGKIVGGVYLGRGQEAFSTALAMSLRPGQDIFAPLIRDQAGRMAFGEPVIDTLRTYLGSVLGPMRGRDGNIHRGVPSMGMPAMISHLGSMISVVCGMLMARRFRGETDVVGAATIGDGGTSTGACHEALNMAAVERLPLVVAVANNQFAYSTPTDRQFACENLADRARGYGMDGHTVDGTDLAACLTVFDEAVSRARSGRGPQLVVGKLLRLCGHGEHDDASYVPGELRTRTENRDCLQSARQTMLENNWTTPRQLETMEAQVYETVQDAVARAQRDPVPDPSRETWAALASHWLIEGGRQ
ncbi:MAG TPA: thiamine pyrophosphate-dependent enzyme [Verrucomicrobiales bacterium]|jgi:pyruvate dehydrogenase E1 component alpha subunit/2-oxoisovalerate dehydrogenase E1 component alpha subunit|nr:thiamine pyrophosphate-dependent enzyme [Verrucomicrobiales bacterium]